MALLAAAFAVRSAEKRPLPMRVVSVRLLYTRYREPVSVVAGSTAKPRGIVDRQELGVRMAGENRLTAHVRRSELNRFAVSQMAGFAAIHQAGILHVDLLNSHPKLDYLSQQTVDLYRTRAISVHFQVFVQPRAKLVRGLRCRNSPRGELSFARLEPVE